VILSFIIVVKNNLPGLRLTLNSIFSSSKIELINSYEILVIDGFSDDGSYQFAREFVSKNKKIKISVSQLKPAGVYNAMNFAIEITKAEWVIFLNSGDILVEKLAKIDSAFQGIHKSTTVIYGGCGVFFSERPKQYFFSNFRKISTEVLAHQSTIYKKNLHEKYCLYREDLVAFSDKYFLDSLINEEKYFLEETISATLVSPKNISRDPKVIISDFKTRLDQREIHQIKIIRVLMKFAVYSFEKLLGFALFFYLGKIFGLIIGKDKIKKISVF